MKPIRILIADDHSLVRHGLSTILKFHKDLLVVGDTKNGAEAVALTRETAPDVVIMDLMMPVMDGVEATRAIKSEHPQTNILILTTFGTAVDVASQFGISQDAVKQQLNVICSKIGAANRAEAAAIALRKHLLKI